MGIKIPFLQTCSMWAACVRACVRFSVAASGGRSLSNPDVKSRRAKSGQLSWHVYFTPRH